MVSTGELFAISQSSILLPQYRSRSCIQGWHCNPCYKNNTHCFSFKTTSNPNPFSLYRPIATRNRFSGVISGSVVPEKVPTALSVDFVEGTEIQTDNTGGSSDNGGGEGGGDNNWGGGNGGGGGEGESDDSHNKHKSAAMSMSQKLTLGYAALVGFGGLMGYLKSGSQKSLISGGTSAAVLYFVYTRLPANPVFASCIGLVLSAALLAVMGLRFKRSGKVFPAGVVAVVSFIMTGGYLHGVMRSLH